MDWKWWLMPAQPVRQYRCSVGSALVMVMLISSPIWLQYGLIGAGIGSGLSYVIAHVLVKLWMKRQESNGRILRIWHGWTVPENADAYENLLKTEIFPGIAAKNIRGYRGIELLRQDAGDEIEFITMMRFDSVQSVKDFVGDDYEQSYVPEKARAVLARFDQHSQHYELREMLDYSRTQDASLNGNKDA